MGVQTDSNNITSINNGGVNNVNVNNGNASMPNFNGTNFGQQQLPTHHNPQFQLQNTNNTNSNNQQQLQTQSQYVAPAGNSSSSVYPPVPSTTYAPAAVPTGQLTYTPQRYVIVQNPATGRATAQQIGVAAVDDSAEVVTIHEPEPAGGSLLESNGQVQQQNVYQYPGAPVQAVPPRKKKCCFFTKMKNKFRNKARIHPVGQDKARATLPIHGGYLSILRMDTTYYPEFAPYFSREEFAVLVAEVNAICRELGPRYNMLFVVTGTILTVFCPGAGLSCLGISALFARKRIRKARRAIAAHLDARNHDTFGSRGVFWRMGNDGIDCEIPNHIVISPSEPAYIPPNRQTPVYVAMQTMPTSAAPVPQYQNPQSVNNGNNNNNNNNIGKQ